MPGNLLTGQSVTQSGGSGEPARDGFDKNILRPSDFNVTAGSCERGVDQLTGHDSGGFTRENEQDVVEFGPLAFVNRGSVDVDVFREAAGGETAQFAGGRYEMHTQAGTRRQCNPDVAVEETQIVVVLGNHDRAARIPCAAALDEPGFAK